MSDWKKVPLGEILTAEQAQKVLGFIEPKADLPALRGYLHSIGGDLDSKGVNPDYLYYVLMIKFNLQ